MPAQLSRLKAWFADSSSDEFRTIGDFRGRVLAVPLLMTSVSALVLLIEAFVPHESVGATNLLGRLRVPLCFAFGVALAILVVGLWRAKPWARWAFGFAALVVMARRGHEAIQLAGQLSWFQTSGNLAWTIVLAGCAVGFLSPGMGRTFACARALLAAERDARANRISLEFTRAEATVLLDWTWRMQAAQPRAVQHPSDQKVLDDFERYLKRRILTADAPNYPLLLTNARQELRDAADVVAPLS